MNRRPICLMCIGLMIAIWICSMTGVPIFGAPDLSAETESVLKDGYSCVIEGTVISGTQKSNSTQYLLKNISATVRGEQIHIQKIKLTTQDETASAPGCLIEARGTLSEISKAGNPGQFDASGYYACEKIYYEMYAEQITNIRFSKNPVDLINLYLTELRESIRRNLTEIMSETSAGILSAMILGDRTGLTEESRMNFQAGGMMHILSISGMHITLIGTSVYVFVLHLCMLFHRKKRPFGRLQVRIAGATAAAVMGIFCLFVGSPVSSVRAYIMFFALLTARMTEKSYDVLCALGLAGILILIHNPGYLFYSGFQLSFAAVVGAAWIYPILLQLIPKKFWRKGSRIRTILHGAVEGMVLWVSIFAATLPLNCRYFFEISTFGMLLNFIVLPIAGILLEIGIAGGMLSLASLTIGKWILMPVDLFLRILNSITELIRNSPFDTIVTGMPSRWQMIVYYVIIGMLSVYLRKKLQTGKMHEERLHAGPGDEKRRWKQKEVSFVIAGFSILAVYILLWRPPVSCSVTMLDVGQGDCFCIRSADHVFLIDGGSSDVKQVGKYRLIPFLKSCGIRKIDGIYLSHADEDHISGIAELLEAVCANEVNLQIACIGMPYWMLTDPSGMQICELAERCGTEVQSLEAGDRILAGELRLEVIHPNRSGDRIEGNEGSMAMLLQYRNFCMLFTGDLEKEGETETLSRLTDVDCLKVAHHGSGNATSEGLLQITCPEIALISVPENSIYHHPHTDTLQRLEDCGADVYMTKSSGAVTLETDGEIVRVTEYVIQSQSG